MEAMVSSGEAVPSWAWCVASLMLAVMAFVSLSMVRWAVLKLRRMSSRGTLRSGASRMIWLSGTSLVGLPILRFHTHALSEAAQMELCVIASGIFHSFKDGACWPGDVIITD